MITAPLTETRTSRACFYKGQKGPSASQQPRGMRREVQRGSRSGEEKRKGDKYEKRLQNAHSRLVIYQLKDNSIERVIFASFSHPQAECVCGYLQLFSSCDVLSCSLFSAGHNVRTCESPYSKSRTLTNQPSAIFLQNRSLYFHFPSRNLKGRGLLPYLGDCK